MLSSRTPPIAARSPTAVEKIKVVVTGAGGRTGSLVIKKLLEREAYAPVGVVRSEKSAAQLREWGAAPDQIVICDLCREGGREVLDGALAGTGALIIATSAVPVINKLSLIPVLLAKLFRREGVRPTFTFKEGQLPEQVDWEAQKLQVDAAKAAGVGKVVLCGSMGGTDRSNFLNTIGGGNILVWKRRAERYLIDSGLNYAIVHPGGLTDNAGGERELVLDVDDALITSKSPHRSIPRADVAELLVQCVALADRRAVDVVAKDPGQGPPTSDFVALLAGMPRNCSYADMDGDEVLGALRAAAR